MPGYLTGFNCLSCPAEFPADYGGYVCGKCGSNLDALYDYRSASREFSVKALKENPVLDIWRYSALYPLKGLDTIPGLEMPLSPLYRAPFLEEKTGSSVVYLKDDTRQPSGSFKDRAGAVVMAAALEKGVKVTSCASTGNAGSSWACMGASCGVSVVVYIPESAPPAKTAQLKVYGARIVSVKGNYDEAYELCLEESRRRGYYIRSTGYNPLTREGKKSVSFEIWEQLGYRAPASVFVPAGDGNILSGVWKGFTDLVKLGLIDRPPLLYAVQSSGSDAICRMVRKAGAPGQDIEPVRVSSSTLADSISVDLPRDGKAAAAAVLESGGDALEIDDGEILESMRETASRSGIFTEPSGAASVAGFIRASSEQNVPSPAVCLLTGSGLKDTASVLKAL